MTVILLTPVVQDQYANYVVQRMIETTDAAMLRELHVIMLQFIHNLTPSINEKMRKNLDINLQKPNLMLLARAYFDSPDMAGLSLIHRLDKERIALVFLVQKFFLGGLTFWESLGGGCVSNSIIVLSLWHSIFFKAGRKIN